MLKISDIVKSIRASRQEFAQAFTRAQADRPPPATGHYEFEAVGRSGNDRKDFDAALRHADQEGWLDDLLVTLVVAGRMTRTFVLSWLTEHAAGRPDLQAIVNEAAGFDDPALHLEGVAKGMRWACKVLVGGQAAGSGVLIARHLVLTAWHVVRPLFDSVNGTWKLKPQADPLYVEFDEMLVRRGLAKVVQEPVRVAAMATWCTSFSACHDLELASKLPSAAQVANAWDFAVIRLVGPLDVDRGAATPELWAQVPPPGADVYVFQYPAGGVQKMRPGRIVAADSTNRDVVPGFRFLHRANAAPGSSGGPCFDQAFNLIGLHQGVWGGANGKVINRGVPTKPIRDVLLKDPAALPALATPIWEFPGTREPVIGCDDLQREVSDSALTGERRVIVIAGGPSSGKTFRARLAGALLPEVNHLKVDLEAASVSKMDAVTLANEISAKAGAGPLKVVPLEKADTSVTAWLKDELLQKLVAALGAARGKRLVWVTLRDLNKTEIDGERASEFLYLLYEHVKVADWLRVVLDGMTGSLQELLSDRLVRHAARDLTAADVRAYVERALIARPAKFTAETIRVPVRTLAAAYDQQKGQKGALADLAADAAKLVEIVATPDNEGG